MGGKHNRTNIPKKFEVRRITYKFPSGSGGSFTGCLLNEKMNPKNGMSLTFFDFDRWESRILLATDVQTPITSVRYPTDVMRMAMIGCVEVLKCIEKGELAWDCSELTCAKKVIDAQRGSYETTYKLMCDEVAKHGEQVHMLYDGTYRVELKFQGATPLCRTSLLTVPLQFKIHNEVSDLYVTLNKDWLRKVAKYEAEMSVWFDEKNGCPIVYMCLDLTSSAVTAGELAEFVACVDLIKAEFKHI